MQIDFHYYGTYALARVAGLRAGVAQTIATAAQYVDDAIDDQLLLNRVGSRFFPEVTAHRTFDFKENTDPDNQRQVWVPFHFLPGGQGESLSEKLVCRKDSDLSKTLVLHALDLADQPFALELIGLTAHVYADTFAHWGFSGVSSRRNRVVGDSIQVNPSTPDFVDAMRDKLKALLARLSLNELQLPNFREVISEFANGFGALGHGAVATCPDQPYLAWSYAHEFPDLAGPPQDRFNQVDYRQAARMLLETFGQFAARRPDLAAPGGDRPYEEIESVVAEVLATVGSAEERTAAWQRAVEQGRLYRGADSVIPDYDPSVLDAQRRALEKLGDPAEARDNGVYRFFQAASLHRWYVLRDLLPAHGIALF